MASNRCPLCHVRALSVDHLQTNVERGRQLTQVDGHAALDRDANYLNSCGSCAITPAYCHLSFLLTNDVVSGRIKPLSRSNLKLAMNGRKLQVATNANEGCNSCASLTGFIACFIVVVIGV